MRGNAFLTIINSSIECIPTACRQGIILRWAHAGAEKHKLVLDAMLYTVAKQVGAEDDLAVVVHAGTGNGGAGQLRDLYFQLRLYRLDRKSVV